MTNSTTTTITMAAPKRDESDVYDRQIRLWGRDSQAKMSQTRVLYIHVTGVSCEVIKNLALAGIKVTLCDNRRYPDAIVDTPCFLLPGSDRGSRALSEEEKEEEEPQSKKAKVAGPMTVAQALKPVIEELNPLLGDCEIVDYQDLNADVLSRYGIVIASRMNNMEDACRFAEQAAAAGSKFFMVDCFGMNGACIIDLGDKHKYRPEKGKSLLDEVELANHVPFNTIINDIAIQDVTNRFHKQPPNVWVQYRCILEFAKQKGTFPSAPKDFAEVIAPWIKSNSPSLVGSQVVDENSLHELANVATADVAPVCAVLGGLIGNEVIKAISGKGEPVNNTLLFDGVTCKGFGLLIQPKPKPN